MTKKEFETLARWLNSPVIDRVLQCADADEVRQELAISLADLCVQDNWRFDRQRFLEAVLGERQSRTRKPYEVGERVEWVGVARGTAPRPARVAAAEMDHPDKRPRVVFLDAHGGTALVEPYELRRVS